MEQMDSVAKAKAAQSSVLEDSDNEFELIGWEGYEGQKSPRALSLDGSTFVLALLEGGVQEIHFP